MPLAVFLVTLLACVDILRLAADGRDHASRGCAPQRWTFTARAATPIVSWHRLVLVWPPSMTFAQSYGNSVARTARHGCRGRTSIGPDTASWSVVDRDQIADRIRQLGEQFA